MYYLRVKKMLKKFETVRTTLTLPVDLLERSQHFVDGGITPSRNALIIAALEQYLLELERQEIDRQFEAMADDDAYQAMNQQISEAFAESDWEALVEDEIE
jgi:hypothetical protein